MILCYRNEQEVLHAPLVAGEHLKRSPDFQLPTPNFLANDSFRSRNAGLSDPCVEMEINILAPAILAQCHSVWGLEAYAL